MALPGKRHLALALSLALGACGPGPEPRTPGAASSCAGPKRKGCERDLAKAAAAGQVPASLVASYVSARAAEDGADPWAKLWEGLSERKGAHAAIVDARPSAGPIAAEGARLFATPPLPEPSEIPGAELLLAMGIAAGYDHVVWLGAGGGERAYELFPRDPLRPQMLGLAAITRDDGAASHVAEDIALAETVRRAMEAAGAFRYVDAASEAARIAEQIERRDPFEEPVLRARYARAMLVAAGITLEPPVRLFGGEPAAPVRPVPQVPAPAGADTPYGDLLRVRVAEDLAAEWKRRGARVLAASEPDRRAVIEGLFAGSGACGAITEPPAFDRAGDVAFSSLMAGALAGAREEPITTTSPKGMPLAAWYPRYEKLVALVDRERFTWLHIGSLVRQRGELQGISSAGTATYRRVTELGLRHIGALRELSLSDPERYQATAELVLAISPGLLGDEPLRTALIDFAQATAKSKIGRAQDPAAIAGTLLVSGFVGLTYPPSIQAAHYLALQSAFAAKIKGDLMTKTGWGTAVLFAADAVVRLFADLGPNLAFSSDQIVRALSDPGVAQPNLAAVVSAAARYAALAKDRPLAAIASAAQSTPERGAAREALRKAIAGMGAPGEAPAGLADEITTLADGLIATLTVVLHRKAPAPGTCADGAKSAADIEVEHALTKLRAVRQKILQSPKYKTGDGLWVRRARLLVALLSDAMDFAAPSKRGEKRALTLSTSEVDEALSAALREWDEPGARDALVGVYSLVRYFLASDPEARYSGGGSYLVRALGGIGRFLRGGGAAGRPTMLEAFAQATGQPAGGDDLASAFLSYSKSFYEKGQPDQGDVFLLGTLLITSVRRQPPPKEAIALAAAHHSRIEWALSLFAEAAAADANGRPNVAAYAAGVRASAASLCAPGRVDDTIDVMGAVAQFTEGKRKEARAALDAVLGRADAEGLVVPKVSYQYAEKHDKKVFTLSFGLTYGLGFVDGANTFQVGLGLSTLAERTSKLTVTAASADETAIETARWYVRAAALASAYHFLDGDAVSGAMDARRAVSAIVQGVRLGDRSIVAERGRWAEDARALLAIDAQLAADAGLPFLSGDLWTIVKDSLPQDTDDAKVAEVLSTPPLGLVGVKDAEAPIERARKSLRVVAAPLACTAAKVETAGFEQAGCGGYPLALALRVADVVSTMPRLKRGPEAKQGSCVALASLDTFLEAASRGMYDPDAFTRSVEDLRASARDDEAVALLARQRRDGHCSPKLLEAARALGRSAALLPGSRADMLSVAVNCAGADAGADLEKDLASLDAETRRLADPMRNLKVMLFAADLALRADRPALLLSLVRGPGFVDRFVPVSGNAAAFALVLHHAAFTLAGEAIDRAPTEAAFSLVCSSFPSPERALECEEVRALRDAGIAAETRKKLAKDAIGKLLQPPAKAPAHKP